MTLADAAAAYMHDPSPATYGAWQQALKKSVQGAVEGHRAKIEREDESEDEERENNAAVGGYYHEDIGGLNDGKKATS